MTKKDELMELLRKEADAHGTIQAEPEELRRKLHISPHDFTKYLWDWKAQGKLTFREDKNGSQIRPASPIQLRTKPTNGAATKEKPSLERAAEQVAGVIATLPWQANGWREWSLDAVRRSTGLNNTEVMHGLRLLRDTGRVVQLGGGGPGKRIHGVRWRNEAAPERTEQATPVESVPDKPKAPSGPSQAVRDTVTFLQSHQKPAPAKTEILYPKLTAALERWHKLEKANQLLRETGNDALADSLIDSEEYVVMSPIAGELEQLLGARR